MGWFEIALTAVALSMDAFAVAVCKGLAMKKITFIKLSALRTLPQSATLTAPVGATHLKKGSLNMPSPRGEGGPPKVVDEVY